MPQPSDEEGGVAAEVPAEESQPLRKNVFICYSHKDETILSRLIDYLKRLERSGDTEIWSDLKLKAGERWRQEIHKAIAAARVAILLISIVFINSDFIREHELPPLLKAAEQEGVWIVPLLVGACREAYDQTPDLGVFQFENDPAKPLRSMKPVKRDDVFDKLATRILAFLKGTNS